MVLGYPIPITLSSFCFRYNKIETLIATRCMKVLSFSPKVTIDGERCKSLWGFELSCLRYSQSVQLRVWGWDCRSDLVKRVPASLPCEKKELWVIVIVWCGEWTSGVKFKDNYHSPWTMKMNEIEQNLLAKGKKLLWLNIIFPKEYADFIHRWNIDVLWYIPLSTFGVE